MARDRSVVSGYLTLIDLAIVWYAFKRPVSFLLGKEAAERTIASIALVFVE